MNDQPIVMTRADHAKLTALLEAQRRSTSVVDAPALDQLAAALTRATLVASKDIPPDVVTMDSTIRVRDLDSGNAFTITVSWPEGANTARGHTSVLSPLGMALLGCRAGQPVQWPVPDGIRRLKVEAVLYQPEHPPVWSSAVSPPADRPDIVLPSWTDFRDGWRFSDDRRS